MPIISKIGRRDIKVRVLVGIIYIGLTIGSLTMLYPFGLMIAGSTKSAVDTPDARLVPPYLVDDVALWQKYVEALFNESLEVQQIVHNEKSTAFAEIGRVDPVTPGDEPTYELPTDPEPELTAVWGQWIDANDLPYYTYNIGQMYAPNSRGVTPKNTRDLKSQVYDDVHGDLTKLNDEYGTKFANWFDFRYIPTEFSLRRSKPTMRGLDVAYREFKAKRPAGERYYFSTEGYFVFAFLGPRYANSLATLNEAWGTDYQEWSDIRMPRSLADIPADAETTRQDWLIFMREIVNLFWIRADEAATQPYRDFLRAKYQTIGPLNTLYGTNYRSFDEIPLITEPPAKGAPVTDWAAFIEGWNDPTDDNKQYKLTDEDIRAHSVDFMFRDHLRDSYGDVAQMNSALGTSYASFDAVVPPQKYLQFQYFMEQTSALRWEFTVRNFVTVSDFMVLQGRGVLNTVIYCLLAIIAALIVNPLAAYALSRYKPPSQYKILLFLMLTMAFPPMVTMIPTFLMLREFNLLNTFWALILPGLANGYSIFLLKGFFDSLPQELYESAEIDGAGEIRIFLQITMSLSKPILAVIALNAFVSAYSNFMMALLICQDQDMWTIMPWLYQLQQRSGEGVVFASLLIAAVPTFVVFSLCQNIIMRGIVVPVEK